MSHTNSGLPESGSTPTRPASQLKAASGFPERLPPSLPHASAFDRWELSEALQVWSYAFASVAPVRPCHALGIEIGVVLRGERRTQDAHGGARFTRGCVAAFGLGERYTTYYEPRQDSEIGREIGFILRPEKHELWVAREVEIGFPRGVRFDPRMIELAEEVELRSERGLPLAAEVIDEEIARFIYQHADLRPLDALGRARLAIHADYNRPLYMRHFAEVAGVHPATFARAFRDRYGIPPARYRMRLRLSEAATLFALHPDLTVREIATRVGFEDVPYFHRAFAIHFKTTPVALGRELAGTLQTIAASERKTA